MTFAEGSRLEKLEAHCFSESGLEEIIIPSSVATIESCAFYLCKRLRKVIFQEGSRLQEICKMCFYGSGLEEFVAPPGLKEIEGAIFLGCESLKRVQLNEGLEALNDYYVL